MAFDVSVVLCLVLLCLFVCCSRSIENPLDNSDVRLVTRPLYLEENIFFEIVSPETIRYTYKIKPAKDFGGTLNKSLTHTHLVPTDPLHACSTIINRNHIKNHIAFIERGECSFLTKTINAEKAGAIAAIIMDKDVENDAKFIDMIHDETERITSLPAYFLLGKDGYMIRKTLQNLHLPSAIVNIPINITGRAVHRLHQPPWRLW